MCAGIRFIFISLSLSSLVFEVVGDEQVVGPQMFRDMHDFVQ